jgi:lauroyl/myristoyl acyltransferase
MAGSVLLQLPLPWMLHLHEGAGTLLFRLNVETPKLLRQPANNAG